MKGDSQRFDRAADDVANRVRKLLADIRPVLTQKHQISGRSLDMAITRGMGLVLVECSQSADITLDLVNGTSALSEDLGSQAQ